MVSKIDFKISCNKGSVERNFPVEFKTKEAAEAYDNDSRLFTHKRRRN